MYKIIMIFVLLVTIVTSMFVGCEIKTNNDVVRIHIRANSNDFFDQEVKLKVRDKVVNFITTKIDKCKNSDEVKLILSDNLKEIEGVANGVLINNNCDYVSSVEINNEYFPSRVYENISFPADYYDALIINLGSGVGDNWWCVAYPPLCFVCEDVDKKVEYKSILIEMLNKIFGRCV